MTTRSYEMMYVLRPDLSEDQVNEATRKYQEMLANLGATSIQNKIWGRRRLAYEIQRFQDGIYVLIHYQGDGSQIAPVERAMRLSEEVIRYITLKLDEEKPEAEDSEPVAVEA
ncbi:30S ribosomal protein S6 [Spirulina subsalsa]|nr:30S ribosomal protein S6 [Spirulina subsalsa]